MHFRVGNIARWSPEGITVFIDTSWDQCSMHVAVRNVDIVDYFPGNGSRLGLVHIRDGAKVLTGIHVFKLWPHNYSPGCGLIGSSWDDRMAPDAAEKHFV